MSITPRAPIGSLLKGDPLGLKKKITRQVEPQPVKAPARAVVTKPQASAPAKKAAKIKAKKAKKK